MKLSTVVKKAARDHHITTRDAKQLIAAARLSQSKKPIQDVFNEIDGTHASIDPKATRLILAQLHQPLSRAHWVEFVQKATAPTALWATSLEGLTPVNVNALPARLQQRLDRWVRTSPSRDSLQVVTFEVAGRPVYLASQRTDFGLARAMFDGDGKSIPFKHDDRNALREVARIRQLYAAHFGSPEMAAWKKAVTETPAGVLRDYGANATKLMGPALAEVLTGAVGRIATEQQRLVTNPRTEVFRNSSDHSLLLVTQATSATGPEHFALFSDRGVLRQRFVIDLER